MKAYSQLTQRGQARRLRRLVKKAVQAYDLDVVQIRLVTNEINGIFRVETTNAGKFILRVASPGNGHTPRHIASEMQFLDAIHQMTNLNLPVPVRTTSGGWVTTVADEGVPQARHCVMYSWVDGKDLANYKSVKMWETFGRVSATLHQLAATFQPPSDFEIYTYNKIFPFEGDFILLDDDSRQHFSPEEFELLRTAVEKVQAEIDQLHSDGSGIIVTHGDLHQWNVQLSHGKVGVIDFEDLLWAHPIQDAGTTLYYNRMDSNYEALRDAFKTGYATVAPFPEQYAGQLETHVLGRRLCILNDVFTFGEAFLRDNPDFITRAIESIRYVKQHVWDA